MSTSDETQRTLRLLSRRAERVHARYRFRFADKPRLTRDPGLLLSLMDELRPLLEEARGLRGEGEGDALVSQLERRLRLYADELKAVEEAREAGADAICLSRLSTRLDLSLGRYRRHFASQSRRTRDLARLDGLLAETESIGVAARAFTGREPERAGKLRDRAARHLDLLENERLAIVDAQSQGTPRERASLYARLANAQLARYQRDFADRQRATRSAELLGRIVERLVDLRREMMRLSVAGLETEENARNIELLTERLALYEREVAAIAAAREGTPPAQKLELWAAETRSLLTRYDADFAGQSRASRDLSALGALCDALGEIERGLWELDTDDPALARQRDDEIALVHDALMTFEREYGLIAKARIQ